MGTVRPRQRIRVAGVLRQRDGLLNEFWLHMQRALTHVPGCVFRRFDATTEFDAALAWEPDGIIIHINRLELIEPLRRAGLPAVNTSAIFENVPCPSVLPDNFAAGRLAGEHLLTKGYRSFAYMGQDLHYARDRFKGFCQAIGMDASDVPWFQHWIDADDAADGTPSAKSRRALTWLDALPDRTGLCLCDDRIGYQLTELMRLADLNPLDRFGIVTCHNRNAPTKPTLSGVQLPEARWAYTAAQLLADMVRGRAPLEQSITLEPLGVVERESTAELALDDPVLRQAVRFIADHVGDQITVPDVAAAVHLGRRAVEKRFVRGLGRTVLTEIHRSRVELAKALLIETDRQLYSIAVDSGMTDEKHLRRLFAKHVGMTPSAFRDQHRVR